MRGVFGCVDWMYLLCSVEELLVVDDFLSILTWMRAHLGSSVLHQLRLQPTTAGGVNAK